MAAAERLDVIPQDAAPSRVDAVIVLDTEDAGIVAVVSGQCAGRSLGLDQGQGTGDLRRNEPRDALAVSLAAGR